MPGDTAQTLTGAVRITGTVILGEDCPNTPILGVRVGAIRFDGWYGTGTLNGIGAPPIPGLLRTAFGAGGTTYYYRLPFFATVTGGVFDDFNGNSQTVVDQEIDYATYGGIDYWAFLEQHTFQDPDVDRFSGLERAFDFYMASSKKSKIKFARIMGFSSYVMYGQDATRYINRTVAFYTDPQYIKTPNGRPIVYMFPDVCDDGSSYLIPTTTCTINIFNDINTGVHAILGVNPYYVILDDPSSARYTAIASIFAATSVYGISPLGLGINTSPSTTAYTTYAANIQNTYASTVRQRGIVAGIEFVPWASVEWNPSVSTHCETLPGPPQCLQEIYGTDRSIVADANPADIATHIRQVIDVSAYHQVPHPETGFPNILTSHHAILTYAWNEISEGGALQPRLSGDYVSPDTTRMAALRAVLRPSCTP